MNVETERIASDDVRDGKKVEDEEEGCNKHSIIFDANNEGMTGYLSVPKRNNIRRLSDELKETASGAIESGVGGIRRAASGLSSGIKTVTNRIPIPKSPKALRRRSWNAYDELEEQIIENDPENVEKDFKKVNCKKDKVDANKDKSKKVKNKGKQNKKKGLVIEGKTEMYSEGEGKSQFDEETNPEFDEKEDDPVLFETLESAELISKVSLNVQKPD